MYLQNWAILREHVWVNNHSIHEASGFINNRGYGYIIRKQYANIELIGKTMEMLGSPWCMLTIYKEDVGKPFGIQTTIVNTPNKPE